jgi:Multicopper oxidase
MWLLLLFLAALLLFPDQGVAQAPAPDTEMHHHMEHAHDGMRMDMEGMVMNENLDRLPEDCPAIAGAQEITVHAGKKYARQFNGIMFTYDQREWQVAPCTKVTVTLVNDDNVRHQWMLHGLPRYIYPEGMFHIEVNGPGRKTGTFIVPSAKKTYLVHCDIAQHTEKGMKAQLKVGGGSGDLPSIPGITGPRQPDAYPGQWSIWLQGVTLVAGLVGAVLAVKGLGLSR